MPSWLQSASFLQPGASAPGAGAESALRGLAGGVSDATLWTGVPRPYETGGPRVSARPRLKLGARTIITTEDKR